VLNASGLVDGETFRARVDWEVDGHVNLGLLRMVLFVSLLCGTVFLVLVLVRCSWRYWRRHWGLNWRRNWQSSGGYRRRDRGLHRRGHWQSSC